jgi:putative acetyltransferase
MQITIRKITEADNRRLAGIIRNTFAEHDAPREGTVYSDPTTDNLHSLFQTPRSALWVALVNGQPEGCCGIYPTEGLAVNHAELVKYYLSPLARGQGIGKRLITKAIETARQYGYEYLYLESLPQFAKAISIYKKLGFQTLDHPLINSSHSSCNIWMVKDITSQTTN